MAHAGTDHGGRTGPNPIGTGSRSSRVTQDWPQAVHKKTVIASLHPTPSATHTADPPPVFVPGTRPEYTHRLIRHRARR